MVTITYNHSYYRYNFTVKNTNDSRCKYSFFFSLNGKVSDIVSRILRRDRAKHKIEAYKIITVNNAYVNMKEFLNIIIKNP